MTTTKALFAIVGIAAAAGFAGTAAAQMPQVSMSSAYIGGSFGQSDLGDACSGIPACDDKDTAWRILGGYQFNRNFAAEIGYSQLGEASTPFGGIEGTAWELVGIGALPLGNQFSIYGKLGFYRGELEGGGVKESNTDLTYGAGVQYDFTKTLGVRGEWQRYPSMGGGAFGREADVDVMSIGVVFRFGQ